MSNKELNPDPDNQDDELEALRRRLQQTEFANDYLSDRNTELENRLLRLQEQYQHSLNEKEAELQHEKEQSQQSQKDTKTAVYWISSAIFALGVGLLFLSVHLLNIWFVLAIVLITVSIAMFSFAFLKMD